MSLKQDVLNRELSAKDRDYFSYDKTLDDLIVKRVSVFNDEAIEVDVVESGIFFNEYDEANSVAGLSTANVVGYTVPVNKRVELKRVSVSGDNRSIFTVALNGSIQSKKRMYYTEYNVDFDFKDLLLESGDILTVSVENKSASIANFNANIIGVEKDA